MFKTHLYHEDVFFYNVKGAGSRTLYAANGYHNHSAAVIQRFKSVAQDVMSKFSHQK
jgi:hypothetical protein